MRHIIALWFLLLTFASAVTPLSNGDAAKADGEYSYPSLRAGNPYVFSLSGTFGGGTATIGYINAAGAFTSLGQSFTAAGSSTHILPENTGSNGKPAISVTGSTTPAIVLSVNKTSGNPITAADITDPENLLGPIGAAAEETWVFEGDSWTDSAYSGWPLLLAGMHTRNSVEVVNVATSGQTAATMAGTFAAQVAPNLTGTTGKPSTLFLLAGINDTAGTTTELRDNLRSMWTAARNAGAKVVAMTLPARSSGGGWSEANWKTINAQIIADSSYYDALVRLDIVFCNGASPVYTDGLHVFTTTGQRKMAAAVWDALHNIDNVPAIIPNASCSAVNATTFAASTFKNILFSTEHFDKNSDMASATVNSESCSVFTVPVDGTYTIHSDFTISGLTAGDGCAMNVHHIPIATGTAVDYQVHYVHAAGANATIAGQIELPLLRGDAINIQGFTTRAGAGVITNAKAARFAVRYLQP